MTAPPTLGEVLLADPGDPGCDAAAADLAVYVDAEARAGDPAQASRT